MDEHYDTLEIGDRASQWLFRDELGSLHTRVEDRAWAVVGMWRMP